MEQVDIGSETYASLATIDEADLYLAGDILRGDAWLAITDEDTKARALVSATRLILGLPLAINLAITEPVPEVAKDVAAMLAADLIADPKLFANASGESNVKSVKAGSASVEFFSPVEGGRPLPIALWRLLLLAGIVTTAADDGGNAGALVTGIYAGRRPLLGRYAGDYEVAALDHDLMGNLLFGVDIAGIVADKIGPGVLPVILTEPRRTAGRTPGNLTGGKAALPDVTHGCRGFWDEFKGIAPPGVTILLGDRKAVLIADTLPAGVEPGHGWRVTIAGETLYIEALIGGDPARAVLTYQCRDRLGPDKV